MYKVSFMKSMFLLSLFLGNHISYIFADYKATIEVTVDDRALTNRDIESRISLMLAITHQENTPQNRNKIRSKAIDMLIRENLQLKEVSKKLKKDGIPCDKEVDRYIKAIADQNKMTEEQFIKMIKSSISHSDGDIVDAFKKQIRAQLAWSKFIRYLGGHVTELEIDRFQKKIDEQKESALYNLSEIVFLKQHGKSLESIQKQANDILKQVKNGSSFYTLAQQFSDVQTAKEGGKLNKKTPQQLDPIILKGLQSMNQGNIKLFETSRGFEIIRLDSYTKNNTKTEEIIDFQIATIPFNPQTITEEDYQAINYKVGMLKSCPSLNAFLKMAKDLNFNITIAKDVAISQVQPEEFGNILKKSKTGDILDPIQMQEGLQILYIENKRMKQNKPLSRNEIEQILLSEKQAKIGESYMNKLIERNLINYK
jgi:parvulin-like peptidyl-prolyl isomerase